MAAALLNKFIKILLAFVIIFIMIFSAAPKVISHFYPLRYVDYIIKYSKQYNLDPLYVIAIIKTESNFNPNAKSNKNAVGLMQITPDTGKWIAEQMKLSKYSEDELMDSELNIRMGCWYVNNLKQEFNGNMDLVLAAYNGGRGNVKKWLSNPDNSKDGKNLHYIPFKETDGYVKKVNTNYNIYKFLYGKRINFNQ